MKERVSLKQIILGLCNNQIVRYIFFGVCTTMVNFVSYYILRRTVHWEILIANITSIFLSILFAFVVNSRFVFQSHARGIKEKLSEFIAFITARLGTMVIEAGGVVFLAWIGIPDMISKLGTQFIVLVLNYVFSKFLVFRAGTDGKEVD